MSGRLIDQGAWDDAPGGGFDPAAMDDLPTFDAAPAQEQPTIRYGQPMQPQYAPEPQYDEAPVSQFAAQMGEAQRRFAKAAYYQELMTGSYFSPADEISAEVEGELKAFVENRLAHLLGIDVGPVPGASEPQFTETEVAVLKAIVGKMQGDPKLGPRVAAVAKPAAPPAPPARPKLQPRPAPAAARPQPPVQRQAPPQPQPARQPPPRQPQRQEAPPPPPKVEFPPDGSHVAEGGRKFKVRHQQMYESEMTPQLLEKLQRMPVGRFAILPDGLMVRRDARDVFTKAHLLNITVQNRDPQSQGIPFPSDPSQMAAATQMRSSEAVNNFSPKISTVAAHVINEG